jgi:hypothetical protein
METEKGKDKGEWDREGDGEREGGGGKSRRYVAFASQSAL